MIGPTSHYMPDSRVNITVLRPCSAIESLVICIGYGSQYFVYLIHSGLYFVTVAPLMGP